MNDYIVLLRGINVGGKNKLAMADIRACLQANGFEHVLTYIQSGNVLLSSDLEADQVARKIERLLTTDFTLDSALIKTLVLTSAELSAIIDDRPPGYGDHPQTFHNDAIFLIDYPLDAALEVFSPRDGVDVIWPGHQMIYSQRLSAERTKSRLGKIIGTEAYRSMTIRSWQTVMKLHELVNQRR